MDWLKANFHLKECTDSAEAAQIKVDWSENYRSLEKFKPFELLSSPIRQRVAEGNLYLNLLRMQKLGSLRPSRCIRLRGSRP